MVKIIRVYKTEQDFQAKKGASSIPFYDEPDTEFYAEAFELVATGDFEVVTATDQAGTVVLRREQVGHTELYSK